MTSQQPPEPPPSRNPKIDMADLRAMWSYTTTDRQRAEIEGRMWDVARVLAPEDAHKMGGAKWLAATLGVGINDTEARMMLRRAQPASDIIWERVDGPERMTLNSAAGIVSRARIAAKQQSISVQQAVEQELRIYDSWIMRRLPNGRSYRCRPPETRAVRASKEPTSAPPPSDAWTAVRAAILRVLDCELGTEMDPRVRDRLRGQCEAEVQSLVKLLNARIRSVKKNADLDEPIIKPSTKRRELRDACTLLGIDPPRHAGGAVDFASYSLAKKNYRKLAREYHPDHNPSPDARGHFEKAVEAMRLVEESYQSTDKGDH